MHLARPLCASLAVCGLLGGFVGCGGGGSADATSDNANRYAQTLYYASGPNGEIDGTFGVVRYSPP